MATIDSNRQRRHPAELRERAVRMFRETVADRGERHGAITSVAAQLGLVDETLRRWVLQAEVDEGRRPGITTAERERLTELERENRELRRANEILRSASAFFAAELDRPARR